MPVIPIPTLSISFLPTLAWSMPTGTDRKKNQMNAAKRYQSKNELTQFEITCHAVLTNTYKVNKTHHEEGEEHRYHLPHLNFFLIHILLACSVLHKRKGRLYRFPEIIVKQIGAAEQGRILLEPWKSLP